MVAVVAVMGARGGEGLVHEPGAAFTMRVHDAVAGATERAHVQLIALWSRTPGGGADTYEGVARALHGAGPGVGAAGPLSTR